MPDPSPGSHAELAIAWVEGRLDAAQRDQFEAHLDGCPDCQSEVARALQNSRKMKALNLQEAKQRQPKAPAAGKPVAISRAEVKVAPAPPAANRRVAWWGWLIGAGVVLLIGGFGLGWWTWLLAH